MVGVAYAVSDETVCPLQVLPLHALQRAEVVCLQLPAPPPLPGVMFVECQRGGLVGAPQPVLVAPSLGVSGSVVHM